MNSHYPFLHQPHIRGAHTLWKEVVEPGDIVIDATCGNGNDTLLLAQLTLTSDKGRVIALDIQSSAIINTKKLIRQNISDELYSRVELYQQSHADFPPFVLPQTVKLIVYNLGYLPGGDKQVTTRVETTLQSLRRAQELLVKGGLMSITCYPGHPEGAREEEAILHWAAQLDPRQWTAYHQRWLNRPKSPTLLLIGALYE